jgi:hypothetical protein
MSVKIGLEYYRKQKVFEDMVMKIFGHKREDKTPGWRKSA